MASFSVLGVDIQPLVLSIEYVVILLHSRDHHPVPTWKNGACSNSPVGRAMTGTLANSKGPMDTSDGGQRLDLQNRVSCRLLLWPLTWQPQYELGDMAGLKQDPGWL